MSDRAPTPRAGGMRARPWAQDEGLTIIELLVAFVILGVVFAGAASFLINSTRITLVNEQRVLATGEITRLHEDLQSIPWDAATLYEHDVTSSDPATADARSELGIVLGTTPVTFEGEPLLLAPDPCEGEPSTCEDDPNVPQLATSFTDDAGRVYEVYTVVTWATDVGAGNVTKRFTTVVTWEVFGEPVTQRFQSVRAPVAAEIEEFGVPTALFNLSPSPLELDSDGLTTESLAIKIEYPSTLADFALFYEQPTFDTEGNRDGSTFEEVENMASPDGGLTWQGSIPSGAGPFEPDTSLLLDMSATSAEYGFLSSSRQVSLVAEGTTTAPPDVISVDVAPSFSVNVRNGAELCDGLTVTATVNDVAIDGNVTLTYVGDGGLGNTMNRTGPSTFEQVFTAGQTSPWSPTNTQDVTFTFNVQASNPDSTSDSGSSAPVTAQRVNGNSCP